MQYWDLFISYAAEDREAVAAPLADRLESAGLSVWIDGRQLQLGDSIVEKIEEGLANSRYGVVILSPAFIANQWPRRELNALFSLEEGGTPRILPVWHDLDHAAVVAYSPILADRLAGHTRDGIDCLARSIAAVVLGDPSSPAARSPSLGRNCSGTCWTGLRPQSRSSGFFERSSRNPRPGGSAREGAASRGRAPRRLEW